jgi:PAS domain S-box-containing protein
VGFKRVILAALVLAMVLAGLIGLLVYSHESSLARARADLAHTHRVIEENQTLFSLVQDAETGLRGYLVTEDLADLAPYTLAVEAIPHSEARLAGLVADNPGQAERVRDLNIAIAERLAVIEQSLMRARERDLDGARAVVQSGAGRAAMTRVRAGVATISATERILLNQRTKVAARSEQLTLAIGVAVGALALVGLMWAVWSLARANADLRRATDDTEEAQTAQAASDALAAALFENSPDYLLVLDVGEDDQFLVGDINPAFERVLHTPADRIRGRAIGELLPPQIAGPLMAHYRRVRAADAPVLTRDTFPGFPEGPRVWESILAPVRNAQGVTDRIIGAVRDITDRVKAEEQLRVAQRMEAIGQLTGGVAHDFNNLLQVIHGNLELLEPTVAADERATRRLKNAMHGAERAGQLTRQLLAFARRQPLEPQVVNLSRLVGEMADLLRRTLGEAIEVETVVAGGLWNTLADPAQVESALLNLALNARDAMPDGGRLTIEITNAVLDEAYAREAGDITAGQYVMLAVTDTGVGMDEGTRERVFEPFFTTKADGKGTGLGLAMVYGFVRQSNGHVRMYSEPSQGTTVKIYLPRSRAAETVIVKDEGEIAIQGDSRTILVVEDEAEVRAAAVAMLEGLGYRCLEAGEAQGALRVLEDGAAVDLVFSDVVMPGPLKTRDFAARIRSRWPGLPILFTSGYTENAIVHQGRLDDGVSLLSKPYAREDLARKVGQLLGRAAEAQPTAS